MKVGELYYYIEAPTIENGIAFIYNETDGCFYFFYSYDTFKDPHQYVEIGELSDNWGLLTDIFID